PPPVQGLVVVTYAIVRDEQTRVLLVRRIDDGNWELPGGLVEVGETASATAVREVEEESGIAIELTGISGVYSDPDHIVVHEVEGGKNCGFRGAVPGHRLAGQPREHPQEHQPVGRQTEQHAERAEQLAGPAGVGQPEE